MIVNAPLAVDLTKRSCVDDSLRTLPSKMSSVDCWSRHDSSIR